MTSAKYVMARTTTDSVPEIHHVISGKVYSHLSNKRGVTLIDFEKKIHPPRTFLPSTFIDFLDFFHPPLNVYCIYILVFSRKSHPPRLFQPPRLLILQLLHPLHDYSNLHGY